MRVIDTASNKVTSVRRSHYRATAISPDGRFLAISDGNVPIIGLETGKQVGIVIAKDRWVRSIAFSAESIASASRSLRMTCSGVCRFRFIENLLALLGR
ncbi:MAG: hypothetical protein WD894_00455 [Pirellulales bacterium]